MGTVTIGTDTFTTFGTIAGANSYLNGDINAVTWATLAADTKSRLLVSATRWLTSIGLSDPASGADIEPIADDTGVPVPVQQGAYELAFVLSADAAAASSQNTGSNVKVAKAGSASVQFFRPVEGTIFPTKALRLLKEYIKGQNTSNLVGCATGGSTSSSFIVLNSPGLNKGFA